MTESHAHLDTLFSRLLEALEANAPDARELWNLRPMIARPSELPSWRHELLTSTTRSSSSYSANAS